MGKRNVTKAVTNGPTGFVRVPDDKSLEILVKAVSTRVVYGRREYEVTPAAGSGCRWYWDSAITWNEEPEWVQ